LAANLPAAETGDTVTGGMFSAVFMRHLRFAWGWLKLLRNEATEHLQSRLPVRLREHLPETPEHQRRTRSRPWWKRVRAGLRDMVPLLEQCYDGCRTNPPAAEEQKDILWGRQARVDAGQLRRSYVCSFCNRYKGPNISGIDPSTHAVVRLFHPRRHKWTRHFRWGGPLLIGRTPIGRATIAVLLINHPEAVAIRQLLLAADLFPIR
jgi:hypothetical protein